MKPEQIQTILAENKRLTNENNLMKRLHTRQGFFEHYFSLLPNYKTFKEAFDRANQDFYDLFGEYRYHHYTHFARQLKKDNHV